MIQKAESRLKEMFFLCKRTHAHTYTHHTHSTHLKGPLISMCPHMNNEGRIVGKFLVANFTAKAGSVFGLAERALEMGQHVLLQGTVGSKSAAARPHWAFERRLACVG